MTKLYTFLWKRKDVWIKKEGEVLLKFLFILSINEWFELSLMLSIIFVFLYNLNSHFYDEL